MFLQNVWLGRDGAMAGLSQRLIFSRAVSPWVGRALGEMARNYPHLFAQGFTAPSRPYISTILQ
jgi:hypothetical protein